MAFLLIATCFGFGMLVRSQGWLSARAPLLLNQFVIYLALPAVILLKARTLEFDQQFLLPMVLPWLLIGITAAAMLWLSRRLHWSRATTGTMLMVVPLGNTSYLGYPMVQAFFGAEALPHAIIYDQLGNFIGLAVYGSIVIALYGSAGHQSPASEATAGPGSVSVLTILRKIISFPPFVALSFCLLNTTLPQAGLRYPALLENVLMLLSLSMVPVTMFIVGLQFQLRLRRSVRRNAAIAIGTKLLAMPLLAALCCWLLGDHSLAARISIFEAGMPPMVTAGAMAIAAGLHAELAAAAVGFGLLLAFVSLPMMVLLMSLLPPML